MLLEIGAERAPRVELLQAGDDVGNEAALRARTREWAAAHPAGAVSRSYCFPYALVAWHGDRIGVDIERIVACDEQFARSICTPAEEERAPWRSDREIVSLWSGKEALAKALGDALRYDPQRLDSPAAWEGGASGPWRASPVPVPDGYCAWVCWRCADGPNSRAEPH
jgi:phosphopantetheinyl transferase